MKYTVILLLPDYHAECFGETDCVQVEADNPMEALEMARIQCVMSNNISMPDPSDLHDLAGVAVFEGHHRNLIVEPNQPPKDGMVYDGAVGRMVREV